MKAVALIIGVVLLAAGVAGIIPGLNNDGIVFGFMPMDMIRSVLFIVTGLVGVAIGMSSRRAVVPTSGTSENDLRNWK